MCCFWYLYRNTLKNTKFPSMHMIQILEKNVKRKSANRATFHTSKLTSHMSLAMGGMCILRTDGHYSLREQSAKGTAV